MSRHNAAMGIFEAHLQAKDALERLKRRGVDLKKVSVIGKDCSRCDRLQHLGQKNGLWVGLWGLIRAAGVFRIPGIGRVFVAGSLISTILDLAEDVAKHDDEYLDKDPRVAIGSLGIVGKGLRRINIPEEYITQCKDALQDGNFILMFQGEREEVEKTREVLDPAKVEKTARHVHQSRVGV